MEEAPTGGIMNNINEYILAELMLDIFSRLPMMSIFQIRSVCKQWNDLVKDPRLPSMHLARASATKEDQETLILTHTFDGKHERTNLELMTEHYARLKLRFHFPGRYLSVHSLGCLLCMVGHGIADRKVKIFVSNLLTGQNLSLPLPTSVSHWSVFGLGFDSSIKKYKMVCLNLPDVGRGNNWHYMVAQVHTIDNGPTGGSSSWREITSHPPIRIRPHQKRVYAGGLLHWLVDYGSDPKDLEVMVISFDFEKEEFKTLPRPESYCIPRSRWKEYLAELRGGYLGMVELSLPGPIQIWKLEDYERNQWIREYRIDTLPPLHGRPVGGSIQRVGLMGDDDIVWLKSYGTNAVLVAYNLKTTAWRDIYTFTYVDDRKPDRVTLHRAALLSLQFHLCN